MRGRMNFSRKRTSAFRQSREAIRVASVRERSGFCLVRPRFFFDAANVSQVIAAGRRTLPTYQNFGRRVSRFEAPQKEKSAPMRLFISGKTVFFRSVRFRTNARCALMVFLKSLNLAFCACTGAEGQQAADLRELCV